ncbi:MAG: bacillithiol biosynthesis deacetylase BshB1 [Ignavibacteriales bacterium]|nr:bacillithiol biosynthesis deacetylase BshB1 [Ignavibacteriales bacterium]
MKLDVLAVAAHPDDIELSCAATVAKLVQQKYKVGVLDLTEGELGTRGTREIRRNEAEAAAKILGFSARVNLKIPDGGIEVTKKNVVKVMQIIRHFQPDILFIPHWQERHPDHVHAHHLVKEAWFYSGLEKIPTTYLGKKQSPFRPKKYFHYMQKYEFQPSFIVDVSGIYERKKESLLAFTSQFYNPKSKERETLLSSKLFLESIYARDRHYGSLINVEYGEPFYSIEPLGVQSVFFMM